MKIQIIDIKNVAFTDAINVNIEVQHSGSAESLKIKYGNYLKISMACIHQYCRKGGTQV